jgi:putative (di)nucleoside polyphosphate hydrolase
MNQEPVVQKPLRRGVGILLLNDESKVWIGRRLGIGPHRWQMPQGGIDVGESAESAAIRELQEETGVSPSLVEITAVSRYWYSYELPADIANDVWGGRYRGQCQRWYLMRFSGCKTDINIDAFIPEFCEWRWAILSENINQVIPFKRPLYRSLLEEFRSFMA